MDTRNFGLVIGVSLLAVGAALASCSSDSPSDGVAGGAGSSGQSGEPVAGHANEAEGGNSGAPGGEDRGGAAGAKDAPGASGATSQAAQGGYGGAPEGHGCPSRRWWSTVTETCNACPAKATVQCSEVVATAAYDANTCTMTVPLPAGRAEIVSASVAVTFNYAGGGPEVFSDVQGTVNGDVLTFDFAKYDCKDFSDFSAEPSIKDSCGDYVELKAPGFGFGPAILVQVTPQGEGGTAGTFEPVVDCGKTN